METKQLSNIPETMLITLWAKATETEEGNGLLHDEIARQIISNIDYDFTKFKHGKLSQIGCCIRANLIDEEARNFLNKHPDAIVIQLGAGLDARYQRMGCPQVMQWFDLDLEEVINIRAHFMPETEKNSYLKISMFDSQWIEKVKAYHKPVLIIIEGVLMYFKPEQVKSFFQMVCEQLGEATVLFDMLAFFALKHSKQHETVKKINGNVQFLWSELNTKAMETWHDKLHVAHEYYMSDYDQGRIPLVLRLLYKLPFFYKRFNQRIVRVEVK